MQAAKDENLKRKDEESDKYFDDDRVHSRLSLSMNGQHLGPVGAPGTVTKGVVLSKDAVSEKFAVADLEAEQNSALKQLVAELQTKPAEAPAE